MSLTTTRTYLSTDSGAPVVAYNVTGSFLAAFRAALVTGYGSKAGAGWTEEFTGTNVAVFRSDPTAGGTGCYVRISDNVASASDFQAVEITAYATMSDVNTGTRGTRSIYAYRHPALQNFHPEWLIVADERTFHFAEWAPGASNQYRACGGAGDVKSYLTGDAFAYGTWGCEATSWQNSRFIASPSGGANSTGDGGISLASDYTGIGGPYNYGVLLRAANPNQVLGSPAWPPRPSLGGADEACMPFLIVRGVEIRGELRGLYAPLADLTKIDPLAARIGGGLGGAGSEFAVMHYGNFSNLSSLSNAGCWVETALPWGD